jgi:hypothetical protein
MKKNSTLSNRLAAYSALAMAGVASIGSAGAQIVYTDVNPDVTFAAQDSFLLDFNSDAVIDYKLRYRTFTTAVNPQMLCEPGVVGNMAMGSAGWDTWNWYGSALNLNDPIDAAGAWVCPGGIDPYGRSCVFFATNFNSATYGNFADGNDHYLGCKFDISGSFHYGWIRVNIGTGMSSMTLLDYAYETQADVAIPAGMMTSGINNANNIAIKVFSNNKKVIVNSPELGGTINIFDNLGQLVKSATIDNNHMVIDMIDVTSAIYVVKVQIGENVITKRINL